jgi:dienelactone hydrolase
MYLWGKEKIVAVEDEHPWLIAFKERCYEGTSYATELCKAGYAVMAIDAFYWGERRLVSDEDLDKGRNTLAPDEPDEHFHELMFQAHYHEDLVARALYQLGHTWQGIWLRDEVRSLDYLCSRPEVDPDRLGCVGLSIGGFRSAQLAGMDPRIKCAVVDGWMTTYEEMFSFRPQNTHYLQYLTGAYHLVDLPDLVSMCCPGALMVIHGTQDDLFTAQGVADAYAKIQAVYDKAGYGERTNLTYYDAPHEFNRQQQADALEWLNRWLGHAE